MHVDVLQIEAEARVYGDSVDVQMRSGEACSTDLPLALVRSVMRTGEMLVLHDARENREWSSDAYVISVRPRSVLCLPLLNQSRLVGLLYVENNLVGSGLFTPKSRLFSFSFF